MSFWRRTCTRLHRIASRTSRSSALLSAATRFTKARTAQNGTMSFTARFALVVLTTAVYLGLAILGWGGAPFFENSARIALVIVTFAMAAVAFYAGGSLSSGVREDR